MNKNASISQSTRRRFLKQSLAAGATFSVPNVWSSAVAFGENNSKPTVAGIGVGGSRGRYSRGGRVAQQASRLGRMVAVCDVDELHNREFNKKLGGKLKTFKDYRELLEKVKPEVVTVGTPDHWHVPICVAALRAGADVYCEKPLTLTIEEGFKIRQVVKETGKVFQVGSQQRSEYGQMFLKAIAIVQSGRLGKNLKAHVAIGGAPSGGPFATSPAPKELDWDMWLGPAPRVDYCTQRRSLFRWWFDYSGGKMTDWGAHHIDIAQWALGHDHGGPVKVSGQGEFPPLVPENIDWNAYLDGKITLPNGFNTPTGFHIELTFADGSLMTVHHEYERKEEGIQFGNGILFEGDEGRIFVNRSKLQGKPIDEMTEAEAKELDAKVVELYGGQPTGHMENFFNCIASRKQPISDVATHVRTMTSCHLCNLSLMLGRELHWDPVKEQFPGDDQATTLMTRAQRPDYMPEGYLF